MTPRCGIDTSILVRLTARDPEAEFLRCVDALRVITEEQGGEIFASNQVVGEAYITLQHHYGISASDARAALVDVLTSGLVAPLNGQAVITALESRGGPGLFDRLIADDYRLAELEILTLDRRMSSLPDVRLL